MPDSLALIGVALPAQAPAKEGLVSVGDVRLKYWDTGGDGEVVVLLHPGTSNAMGWEYQQPVLAKAGYRVIAYSRRGHGGSDLGPTDNMGTAANDLRKLLDALNVDAFHAVGVAAGGIYAADFALAYPSRVRSLVVAGSIVAVGDQAYMKRSSALRPKGFEELPAEFRELSPQYRAGFPEGVARWKEIWRANAIDPAATPNARQAPKSQITLAALKTLTMPVLLITGDADLYMPPVMLRDLIGAFPQSSAAVIKGAGHAANWEQPEAFNALLVEFLSTRRRH